MCQTAAEGGPGLFVSAACPRLALARLPEINPRRLLRLSSHPVGLSALPSAS